MRKEQTIHLDETRTVTLRELRLRDVRRLVAELKDSWDDLDVTKLFGEQFDQLLTLVSDCIEMPDGETAEDLSFSEIDSLIKPFKEVNASFLEKLRATGLGLAWQTAPEPSETSTAAPSDSSSEDIETSGTTAGDSSKPVLN